MNALRQYRYRRQQRQNAAGSDYVPNLDNEIVKM